MYHFIVNPMSRTGKGKEIWKELYQILKNKNIEFCSYFTKCTGHATKIAASICMKNKGIKKIIIVGGDGTVNEVINGLTDYKDILLGYIPTGSSNDLARGLKLEKVPKAALEHVLSPHYFESVDHGIVTFYDGSKPRKFAVSSGIGYDAAICHEALNSPIKKILNKLKLGKLTYFIIGIRQILINTPVDAEIIIDGIKKIKVSKMRFAASMIQSCEGGGLPMAPTADYKDGKLTICCVFNVSKLKFLLLMPTIFLGLHTHIQGVNIFDCRSLEIRTKKPLVLHLDGEYGGIHSRIHVTCLEDQIRMFQ